VRKRPQFFEDLDRELHGEPEAAPEQPDGQVHVEAVTRVFYQPAAFQAAIDPMARYCGQVNAMREAIALNNQQALLYKQLRQAPGQTIGVTAKRGESLMDALGLGGIFG
jgi:hypothetical protein